MDANADATSEEAVAVPRADFEALGGVGGYALCPDERRIRVEPQRVNVGPEGLAGSRGHLRERRRLRRGHREAGDGSEAARGLGVPDPIYLPNEVYDIAASATAREAEPHVLVEVNDEGGGIVPMVDRTGADKARPPPTQSTGETPSFEEANDRHRSLETAKVKRGIWHVLRPDQDPTALGLQDLAPGLEPGERQPKRLVAHLEVIAKGQSRLGFLGEGLDNAPLEVARVIGRGLLACWATDHEVGPLGVKGDLHGLHDGVVAVLGM